MANVLFQEQGEFEFESAVKWYEFQKKGLGIRFFQIVNTKIDAIAANPTLFPSVYKNLKKAGIEIFPYSIIYSVKDNGNTILIVGIIHQKRKPSSWQRRAE